MNWLPANSAHSLTIKLIGTDGELLDYVEYTVLVTESNIYSACALLFIVIIMGRLSNRR